MTINNSDTTTAGITIDGVNRTKEGHIRSKTNNSTLGKRKANSGNTQVKSEDDSTINSQSSKVSKTSKDFGGVPLSIEYGNNLLAKPIGQISSGDNGGENSNPSYNETSSSESI